MKLIKASYVITKEGDILVQLPDSGSRHGFSLYDDDCSYDGGIGVSVEWESIPDDDPRITDSDRDRVGWILDEYRKS